MDLLCHSQWNDQRRKKFEEIKEEKRLEFILHVVFFFFLRGWLFVLPCSSFKRGELCSRDTRDKQGSQGDSFISGQPASCPPGNQSYIVLADR
jgi:hypothetical protein